MRLGVPVVRALALVVVLQWAAVGPASAQSSAEIAAEPILKLPSSETVVPGQCLTREELDHIAGLNALRRPTVGVEGDGDDPAPFDPHYFIGTWRIEGVLPESPLGPSGDFVGTETIRHVEGCTYEGTLEATQGGESFRVESRMVYDRREHYLVRTEIDSRGSTIMKIGPMRGDPGGFTSHHWIAPAIEQAGTVVRMSGRTFVSSPYAYRLRMEMAIDDEPSMNFGTLWWERVED
jgi:hypothetical protein